jgi:membrane protein implicated in regulation of membrane protease activity
VNAAVQLLAFAALSVGSLALTRPALARAAGRARGIRTGVDAMQGRIGVVTRPIAELEPGQIKVGGEIWTARSFYDGESIPAGSRVEVVKVEGVTALVIHAPSPYDGPSLEREPQHHG